MPIFQGTTWSQIFQLTDKNSGVPVDITGWTFQAGFALKPGVFAPGGQIQSGTLVFGGFGAVDGTYTNVPLIHLTAGYGLNATANIVVSGGVVTSLTIVNPGYSYAAGDYLTTANQGAMLWRVLTVTTPGDYVVIASAPPLPNYGKIDVVDGPNGRLKLTINRDSTRLLPLGRIKFDVVRLSTNIASDDEPVLVFSGSHKVKKTVTLG